MTDEAFRIRICIGTREFLVINDREHDHEILDGRGEPAGFIEAQPEGYYQVVSSHFTRMIDFHYRSPSDAIAAMCNYHAAMQLLQGGAMNPAVEIMNEQ